MIPDPKRLFKPTQDASPDNQANVEHRLAALVASQTPIEEVLVDLYRPVTDFFGMPHPAFCPPLHQEAAGLLDRILQGHPVNREEGIDIVERLCGFYPVGPRDARGIPEFGTRLFDMRPVCLKAAQAVYRCMPEIQEAFTIAPR